MLKENEVYWARHIAEEMRKWFAVDEVETKADADELAANEFVFHTYDDNFKSFRVLIEPCVSAPATEPELEPVPLKKTWRCVWCQCPTRDHPTSVNFVEAPDKSTAEKALRHYIEARRGAAWFVIDSIKEYEIPKGGKVVDG